MLSPDKVLNKGYTQEELALGSPFAVALKHNMMNCKKNLATVLAEAAQARGASALAADTIQCFLLRTPPAARTPRTYCPRCRLLSVQIV